MAGYNRYHGNTGRVTRVDERRDERPPGRVPEPPVPVQRDQGVPRQRPPAKPLPLLGGSLSELLPKSLSELETDDIILLLILYLMYRESGDSELLIIMGAMFLL